MKIKSIFTLTVTVFLVVGQAPVSWANPPKMKMTSDIPVSITTPDKVKTSIGKLEFFDGVPTEDTVEKVYDYVDGARAVPSYPKVLMNVTGSRPSPRRAGSSSSVPTVHLSPGSIKPGGRVSLNW